MHMIDLTPVLQAVITLAAALITYRLVPWLKARMTETQYSQMLSVVDTLVYAADKLYRTGKIQDKLDYVQNQLIERGYEIDRAAIEAAVTELDMLQDIESEIKTESEITLYQDVEDDKEVDDNASGKQE